MTINWLTKKGLLGSYYEKQEVYVPISYEENPNIKLEMISGSIPNGTEFAKINDSQYVIRGTIEEVSEITTYGFTIRATLDDEISDRYFEIIVETYDIDWVSETLFEESQEYSYISKYFQLRNPNGNEQYVKIAGILPDGITLNSNGLLYGTIGHINESTDYNFTIGVFVNNELVLQKKFVIVVHTLGELNLPMWITQEGILGYLDYNEESDIKINVYEPLDRPLTFIIKEGRLPEGLILNERNGYIEGSVKTENESTWEFTVVCSNGFNEITRTFSILTNVVDEKDRIIWLSDTNLGEFSVGQQVELKIEAKSSSPIFYQLISGKLPKGLTLNNKGYIYGTIDYQDIKEYQFTINARTNETQELKLFYISVKKGLGKNALRSYLYINLEYLDMYNDLKNSFDYTTSYRPFDKNYIVPYKPEIPVANLRCFDKVLLQNIIQFNLPYYLTTKKTNIKQIIENDEHLYDVYYKELDESNSSPEDEYINYLSNKQYIKQNENGVWVDEKTEEVIDITGDILSEEVLTYMEIQYNDNIYKVNKIHEGMWITSDEKKVIFGNPTIITEPYYDNGVYKLKYYYLDEYNKIYVEQLDKDRYFNIDTNIVFENIDTEITEANQTYQTKYYFRNPIITYTNVPSLNEIRTRLEQQFVVRKLENDTWYDINTEEFIDVVDDNIYEIKYDEQEESYYIEYNKIPTDIELIVYDPKTGELFEDTTLVVNPGDEWYDKIAVVGKNEFGKVWVNYKNFEVVNKINHNFYRNMIFTLPDIKYPFVLDSNGQIHFVAKTNIEERNWYYFDKNDNIIDMESIVLPYITDEDVDEEFTIQFFNSLEEILPKWMNNKFFPRMEIFYGQAGKNYKNLLELNDKENNLEMMTERLLAFYCLTFKPLFDKSIEPFDIFFDYHNYKMSPHKLI